MRCLCKLMLITIILSTLVGCANSGSGSISGKYFNEKNATEYIELDSDGNATVGDGFGSYGGKYTVNGNKLSMDFGVVKNNDTINGNTITDAAGEKYTKK